MFELRYTDSAEAQLRSLRESPAQTKRFKAVSKAIRTLAHDPRHPSLNTHEWHETPCDHGGKLFEAYAENHTPGAYRIWWCYVPGERAILINAIGPHP